MKVRHVCPTSALIVTAKEAEADRVVGLELGADDYVTKPFSMLELFARVRAHLRRSDMAPPPPGNAVLVGGPVRLDHSRHEVLVGGEPIQLTPKEYELLATLLSRKSRLLTPQFLLDEIWGRGYEGSAKTLDVHIKRPRGKIEEDPRWPRYLLTVRGLGYKFVED